MNNIRLKNRKRPAAKPHPASMEKTCLIALPLFLTSCLVGPDYNGVVAPDLPASWVNALPPSTSEDTLVAWWGSFGDAQLDALISRALEANPDMVNAALAIAQAESRLRAAGAQLYPSASATFGGTNSGSFETSTSHGRWNGGLSASWSPDIWGGDRRNIEAVFASLGSAAAAAAATQTALASSVASTYFEWISAQESLRTAKEQLKFQERSYDITRRRVEAGYKSSNLDLAEAQVTIANTRAQIPTYEANIKLCENTLATLLGTTVDRLQLAMPSPATYNKIPAVPLGLPSDLLRRRPDIIRAEANLHKATAEIGVNVANLFPRISLTGNLTGNSGTDFAHYFSTAVWSLGASVSQNIFNRTQLNENVKLAELAQASAGQDYRKAVLAAFAEVEEALVTYAKLANQLPQYEAAAAASRIAAELSLRRFNSGETDYLNVAAAQRSLLSAELSLVSTRQQIRMCLARLCTAMGGGWGTNGGFSARPSGEFVRM